MGGAGYERALVIAYLDDIGERREDGGFIFINGIRVLESNRTSIRRWEEKLDIVPLARLDAVLMRYDLMTFEFEQWAHAHHGRDGFVDPLAEPAGLAA